MQPPSSVPDAWAWQGIPSPIGRVLEVLEEAGHPSYLVGGCVRDAVGGRPIRDFDVATPAEPDEVLRLFPRAVPVGIRHGTVMVPTVAGPVDVTRFRGGPDLESDLAHRDFTLNAMAWDPRARRLRDPCGGREDLARRRLRAVGNAADRFAEDPLRALRGARLAAELSLEVAPELERAMAACVVALRGVARERVRRELAALLLAPEAGRGLALLRRTGLEADIAPGAAADAATLVPALPADLELRLAAWLRGARHGAILRSLRCSRRTTERVDRLLRAHPLETGVDPLRDVSVRRLLKRVGRREVGALLALRRGELTRGEAAAGDDAAAGLRQLDALEAAVRRVDSAGRLALRRQDLAIDGQEVMRVLGRGPGPAVGRALSYLTEQVVEDPARNTPETLRALLGDWSAAHDERGEPRGS